MEWVLSFLAAFAGALVGCHVGRAGAMDARVEPLRAAVADLVERFEHATRRWSKRERDAAGSDAGEDGRQRRLAAIWKRVRG